MGKEWKGYRKFNGVKYDYVTSFPQKLDAENFKKVRKAKGHLVRIVKEKIPGRKMEYSLYEH